MTQLDDTRDTAMKMLDDAAVLRAAAAEDPCRASAARLRQDASQLVATARRLLRRAARA